MNHLFINDKRTLVRDAIDGLLYTNQHNNLTYLDVDKNIRIVTRNDWQKDKVAIISGGGSGHEPAHAGFVGKGMLTAAVCGDLFASPSVDAVLNAIVHVTGKKGCLVIVKNYTGDRLNFGLACEKAKKMGLNVDMVIVDDDISLPDSLNPRGIAGTLFVHKVAGYTAEQGSDLNQVKNAALGAINVIASIGLAVTSCSLPGEEINQRIAQGKAELGLGIHGEPGVKTIEMTTSKELVATMVEKLRQSLSDKNVKLAIMINNLGGVSPLEMSVISNDILNSSLKNNIELLVGPSAFMTAIDMRGFSISYIELTAKHTEALLFPVEVEAWKTAISLRPLPVIKKEKVSLSANFEASDNPLVFSIVEKISQTLIKAEKELNHLDSLVGDGDTGATFAAGAQQVLAQLKANKLPLNDMGNLFSAIAEELSTAMGGSSGVLFSIFFTAAGHHCKKHNNTLQALQAGLQKMMQYGGAQPGDRTMIDALYPAFEAWEIEGLQAAINAAKIGAESTALMLEAKAGRSSYVNSEHLQGVKDPGSVAIERVFEAFK